MAPFEKNSVAAKLQLPIPMLCDSGITEEQLDTLYEILSALQSTVYKGLHRVGI